MLTTTCTIRGAPDLQPPSGATGSHKQHEREKKKTPRQPRWHANVHARTYTHGVRLPATRHATYLLSRFPVTPQKHQLAHVVQQADELEPLRVSRCANRLSSL